MPMTLGLLEGAVPSYSRILAGVLHPPCPTCAVGGSYNPLVLTRVT